MHDVVSIERVLLIQVMEILVSLSIGNSKHKV